MLQVAKQHRYNINKVQLLVLVLVSLSPCDVYIEIQGSDYLTCIFGCVMVVLWQCDALSEVMSCAK